MTANTSYFRVRREIFAELTAAMDDHASVRIALDGEIFLGIRQFLVVRNDDVSDDKRLSFDKAVLQARVAAQTVLRTRAHAGLVATALHAAASASSSQRS